MTIFDSVSVADFEWHDDALCAQTDPTLFDTGDHTSPNPYAKARAICKQCPVAARCLTWALENDEQYGIWGGMTPGERKAAVYAARTNNEPNWVKAKRASDEAFAAKARATLKTDAYHKSEGRTNADIAAMLGIHPDSYGMRLTRARRLLARQAAA
jgi:WhiB family redox-sensing transcriptional regulator